MRAWIESAEQLGAPGSAASAERSADLQVVTVNEKKTRRLSEATVGERCVVVRLEMGQVERVRRLVALGVMPGSAVEVHQRWPGVVFRMGFSEFAVDVELASAIFVQPE